MTYRKSSARNSFDSEIDTLLREVRLGYRGAGLSHGCKELLLGSLVFLASAKLECYLSDLVTNWVVTLNSSPISASSMPKVTRAFLMANESQLISHAKNYVSNGDERRFYQELSKSVDANSSRWLIGSSASVGIRASHLLSRKKYPSPDNISALFFRIGLDSVLHKVNAQARANMEAKLNSFNDLRTAIAHSGIPTGMSFADVVARVNDVKKFVASLDKVSYKHITSVSSRAHWA